MQTASPVSQLYPQDAASGIDILLKRIPLPGVAANSTWRFQHRGECPQGPACTERRTGGCRYGG